MPTMKGTMPAAFTRVDRATAAGFKIASVLVSVSEGLFIADLPVKIRVHMLMDADMID
jgi:hypothetical protein